MLLPNNFVCTTAVKAYGRLFQANKAMSIVPWLESVAPLETPDIYLLSSLLYVCAKQKMVSQAEKIFWVEIPKS